MKSILFISPEYPPETGGGGIGTYVREMAGAIKSFDPLISVSVLSVSFEKNKRANENGVEVIRLLVNRKNPLSIYATITLWLLRNYKKYAVIEDEVFGGYSFLAKLLLGKKFRYIARLHGTSHEVYVLEWKGGLRYWIFRPILNFFEKFITKKAQVILTSSSLMGVYSFFLWKLDFSRMNVAPLPMLVENFEPKKDNLLKKLQDKKYFLFYGSAQRKKGSDVLRELIGKILADYPEMYFVILGPDRGGLINFFKGNERVIFLGYMGEKKQCTAVIGNAQAVILPSQFEAFLYTALEAIFLGVPTIVTRNCGMTEYLQTFSDYNNIVVNQNDVDEFREKLEMIMRYYEQAKLKTNLQREALRAIADPQKVAKQYLALIEEKYYAKRNI
jgi:glycosyltransferase involved in cell wall biosynthesis